MVHDRELSNTIPLEAVMRIRTCFLFMNVVAIISLDKSSRPLGSDRCVRQATFTGARLRVTQPLCGPWPLAPPAFVPRCSNISP